MAKNVKKDEESCRISVLFITFAAQTPRGCLRSAIDASIIALA
jgi:hypothetical protein